MTLVGAGQSLVESTQALGAALTWLTWLTFFRHLSSSRRRRRCDDFGQQFNLENQIGRRRRRRKKSVDMMIYDDGGQDDDDDVMIHDDEGSVACEASNEVNSSTNDANND